MKKTKEEKRENVIIKTSIIGIFINLLLVIFKVIIGLISNSIAIILDAVNNLSDALSSIVTIIATKLAESKPDKESRIFKCNDCCRNYLLCWYNFFNRIY